MARHDSAWLLLSLPQFLCNILNMNPAQPLPPPSGYQAPLTPQPAGFRSGRDFPNSVFDKLQDIAPLPGQAPIQVVDDQGQHLCGITVVNLLTKEKEGRLS